MKRLLRLAAFGACLVALLVSGPSLAGDTVCNIDKPADAYNAACPSKLTTTDPAHACIGSAESGRCASFGNFGGSRTYSMASATVPIDVWDICRYVDNKGSQDYFVPFRKVNEWQNFYTNYPTDKFRLEHCARPVDGDVPGLYYGATTMRGDMGDTGESTHPVSGLPYARTGSTFMPPNYTFNNSCYEESSEYHCFGGHWEDVPNAVTCEDETTCKDPCEGCAFWACFFCAGPPICTTESVCKSRGTHKEFKCDEPGTTCRQDWHDWHEEFNFTATAGDSDIPGPSWTGYSQRVNGVTRPNSQCTRRCKQVGHECYCDGTPPGSSPSSCSVPEMIPYNYCAVYACYRFRVNWNACAIATLAVIISNNNVDAYLAAGDTCSAMNERNNLNKVINDLNTSCTAMMGF